MADTNLTKNKEGYDNELGYTEKIEHISKDQIEKINGKTYITLYGRFEEGE